jgi:hypothetical protein
MRILIVDDEPGSTSSRRFSSYIEAFYNRQRRHTRLGMLSPADYEPLPLSRLGA